jgi:hypothetical protein
MTSIEHRQLKGITIKNIVVTIISTASIVTSVMASYFQLRSDISEVKVQQEAQNRVNEVRLRILEGQVTVLQREVEGIKLVKNKQ